MERAKSDPRFKSAEADVSTSERPPVSGVVPPPPAQLVAVLNEFETHGPDSFRKSAPDIAESMTRPVSKQEQGAATGAKGGAPLPDASRASQLRMAAIGAVAIVVLILLWALLLK